MKTASKWLAALVLASLTTVALADDNYSFTTEPLSNFEKYKKLRLANGNGPDILISIGNFSGFDINACSPNGCSKIFKSAMGKITYNTLPDPKNPSTLIRIFDQNNQQVCNVNASRYASIPVYFVDNKWICNGYG